MTEQHRPLYDPNFDTIYDPEALVHRETGLVNRVADSNLGGALLTGIQELADLSPSVPVALQAGKLLYDNADLIKADISDPYGLVQNPWTLGLDPRFKYNQVQRNYEALRRFVGFDPRSESQLDLYRVGGPAPPPAPGKSHVVEMPRKSNNTGAMVKSQVASAPVATTRVRNSMSKPRYQGLRNGDMVVTNEEYITDINGSVAFTANTFAVNPGLPGSFPWLSGVAQRFESYVFDSLVYRFETESTTASTGSVVLVIDYDCDDVAPSTKSQALSYRSAVRSAPWKECSFISLAEDRRKRSTYYVRSGSLGSTLDKNLYDIGNLFVCTQGQAGTTVVGELHVSYVVRLMTPQVGPIGIGEAVYGQFQGTSNSSPFGSAAVQGNLPATFSSSGTTTSVTTFTFTQPWRGYVTCSVVGTGLGGINPTGTASSAEVADVVNAGTTQEMSLTLLSADIAQTYIITITNTTITGTTLTFGQGYGNG